MGEKDKRKAELILAVEAAKARCKTDKSETAKGAFKDAVKALAAVAPFTAADYEWGFK